MTTNSKDDDPLGLLGAAHFNELLDMADGGVLEGVDLPKLRTDKIQLLAAIKSEAECRRLAAAKSQMASPVQDRDIVAVSVDEMRAFLRMAANDPRITMAARALDDMTDESVIRTYR